MGSFRKYPCFQQPMIFFKTSIGSTIRQLVIWGGTCHGKQMASNSISRNFLKSLNNFSHFSSGFSQTFSWSFTNFLLDFPILPIFHHLIVPMKDLDIIYGTHELLGRAQVFGMLHIVQDNWIWLGYTDHRIQFCTWNSSLDYLTPDPRQQIHWDI